MTRKHNNSAIKVAGFFRLNVVNHNDDGTTKVVGDSGWCKNLVTNLGFQHYIVEAMGGITGSSQVSSGAAGGYFALGLGTAAPAVTDTSLTSELTDAAGCRFTMTPSVVSSKTLQMVGTLASNVITANRTIGNIGIFATSAITAGSILCANTYTTSQLSNNQSVNVTYQLRFATA
jgi:hypothetical protein